MIKLSNGRLDLKMPGYLDPILRELLQPRTHWLGEFQSATIFNEKRPFA